MFTQFRSVASVLAAMIILSAATSAQAQYNSGSDGSDGALNVTTGTTTIDLGLAANAVWTTPAPTAGRGVYDSDQWAVVFKYTTINVSSGATVKFTNHPKGAPVVWLASGNVTIAGTVDLNGANGSLGQLYATPGAGGFAGGTAGSLPSCGFGPGGGFMSTGTYSSGQAGSYATKGYADAGSVTYGNTATFPLIGGSGGGGYSLGSTWGGGAGGGAILIASGDGVSTGTITINGQIRANGGDATGTWDTFSGCGSGGAIRLIAANQITGSGALNASGGGGGRSSFNGPGIGAGDGRIRVEAPTITLTGGGYPTASASFAPGVVFPNYTAGAGNAPKLWVVSVDSVASPSDPAAGVTTTDVVINNSASVIVSIAASNIPTGTTVSIILQGAQGNRTTTTTNGLTGTFNASTVTKSMSIPAGKWEMQLKANW